jgi:excisionase family DNA binding protein
MNEKLAYRVDDAAKSIGISRATLYRWIASGKLKTVKVGAVRLVSAKALHSLIERGVS